MGNKMGSAASKVSRNTVQKFNAENRAHKVMEKEKIYHRVAPKHESTKKLLDDFSRGRFCIVKAVERNFYTCTPRFCLSVSTLMTEVPLNVPGHLSSAAKYPRCSDTRQVSPVLCQSGWSEQPSISRISLYNCSDTALTRGYMARGILGEARIPGM